MNGAKESAGTSRSRSNDVKSALPSDSNYKLPDPDGMLNSLNREIKELNLEAKRLFHELEVAEKEMQEALEEAKKVGRKDQKKRLKGNELMNLRHLTHLGFEEEVIREHVQKENKILEKLMKKKAKEVKNVEGNIDKMIQANQECEKAVTAAQGAYGQLIVSRTKLQVMLDHEELVLYAQESKVEHRRNMKSVEIFSKDGYKKGLKEIVKLVQHECKDTGLVRDVLKVAGKCLSTDAGLKNFASEYGDDSDSDSDSSVEIKSAGRAGLATKASRQGDSSDSDNGSDIEIASKDSEIQIASSDSDSSFTVDVSDASSTSS